jgi:transposase
MKSMTLWVGLDVHKESISVAVFDDGRAQQGPVVTIPNEPTQIRKLFSRLKKEGEVRACYEAGSCGYEVYRQLATMGIACDVIAPGLIPVRVGDRVKTDRRDAEKLARLFRAGELTSIRVPSEAEEALRDLIRCREDAREDVLRQRPNKSQEKQALGAQSPRAFCLPSPLERAPSPLPSPLCRGPKRLTTLLMLRRCSSGVTVE